MLISNQSPTTFFYFHWEVYHLGILWASNTFVAARLFSFFLKSLVPLKLTIYVLVSKGCNGLMIYVLFVYVVLELQPDNKIYKYRSLNWSPTLILRTNLVTDLFYLVTNLVIENFGR